MAETAAKQPMDVRTMHMDCDSTEFCPVPGFQDVVAVSMYQLDESTGTRNGRVQLYNLCHNRDDGTAKLSDCGFHDCSGVFDLKWRPTSNNHSALAATALADGSISFLQVPEATAQSITPVAMVDGAAGSGMALSCAWSPHDSTSVLASSSDGTVSSCTLREAEAAVSSSWHAHDYEAWVVTADAHNARTVYSGADDCLFKGWDTRQPNSPTFVNKRAHGAGVCCIHSHLSIPHLCATGSYDEYARLWDMRNTSVPVNTSKVSVGGGVWRFKWHPSNPKLALLACMHNGFSVLEMDDEQKLTVCEDYPHQKTLGYGADWWHGGDDQQPSIAATCSFYDKSLHLWQPTCKVA